MSSLPRPIVISTVTVIIVMVLASIQPLAWSSYLLHQAGTLLALIVMLAAYHYWHIRSKSYVLATLFLLIHIVGARYLYSYVPYDDWIQQVFAIRLSELFGWQRNMYDRLVHFSYGLLLFGLMFDSFKHAFKNASTKQLIALVLLLNLASSALYELFEWALAMTMSPEAAEAYNGQQGDIWDAHKDMALALLGGIVAAGIVIFKTAKPFETAKNSENSDN